VKFIKDPEEFRDKVVIAGGGDSAGTGIFLADIASEINSQKK
jgi:thioredoxin reductase